MLKKIITEAAGSNYIEMKTIKGISRNISNGLETVCLFILKLQQMGVCFHLMGKLLLPLRKDETFGQIFTMALD